MPNPVKGLPGVNYQIGEVSKEHNSNMGVTLESLVMRLGSFLILFSIPYLEFQANSELLLKIASITALLLFTGIPIPRANRTGKNKVSLSTYRTGLTGILQWRKRDQWKS